MASSKAPLACVPDALAPEIRRRHFALIPRLLAAAQESHPLPNGYAIRFGSDRLKDIANFVINERKCCPFLDLAIMAPAGSQAVWLRMTGPRGTREFLDRACDDPSQYEPEHHEALSTDTESTRKTKPGGVTKAEDIKTTVRKAYAEIAVRDSACCEPTGGCGITDGAGVVSRSIGYSANEIAGVPEGANLGLGCGNPWRSLPCSRGM